MRQRFEGKNVVITGASSGIGAALARAFAREGANVVLGARRMELISAIAGEIERDTSRRALPIACDVTRDGDVEALVEAGRSEFGPASIVVANAGYAVGGSFESLTLEDFRAQFETNVFGVIRTAYAALEDLTQTGGALVIIGSVASYAAVANASAYAMSKFAVRAFADSIRAELAPREIAVVLVVPGYVDSEIRWAGNRGRQATEPDAAASDRAPQALVMPAPAAARAIVDGVARGRSEIVFPFHARAAVLAARIAPGSIEWALRRRWLRRLARGEEGD